MRWKAAQSGTLFYTVHIHLLALQAANSEALVAQQ